MDDDPATGYQAMILATMGPAGRMISHSKTAYRQRHPDHAAVFNANLCIAAGKLWWGDLDLSCDEDKLVDLARLIGQTVYLLYEHDGRFKHEDSPLLEQAVYSVTASGHTRFDAHRTERRADDKLPHRPIPRPPRWHLPTRPHLWQSWHVNTTVERSMLNGTLTSRLLRFGRRGSTHPSPLLVLGLHTWSRDARGGWVEWTWYPSGHRAWTPPLHAHAKRHSGPLRPYISLRIAPGVAHELRLGIATSPNDMLWG